MRFFFVTLLLAMLTAVSPAAPGFAADRVLINGFDAAYSPFAYVDKAGKATGFDIEALNWIAAKMGFAVTHAPRPWGGIMNDLLAKRVDMICSGMSITRERTEKAAFSEPYFSVRKILVTAGDKQLTAGEILMGGKRLAVQRGTGEAEWLDRNRARNNWNYELAFYDSSLQAMTDAAGGVVDAAGVNSVLTAEAVEKHGLNVRIAGEFAPREDFGIAVRHEDKELLARINEGLRLLRADPFWEELHRKYLRR